MKADLAAIKTKLTEYFGKRPDVRFVTLFGSYATNRANAKSDVDIAIDCGRPLAADELATIMTDLALLTGCEVDVVDLTVAYGAILEEAIVKGIPILQRSPEDFARLLKKLWYDKEDDGRARRHTMDTRLKLWQE